MMAQAPKSKPEAARRFSANFSKMAKKAGVSVPAAWPAGSSLLVQAYEACRRCESDEVCADWLERTPDSIQLPPEFCPNAAELTRLKKRAGR